MIPHDKYPVVQEAAIRSYARVLGYSALRDWFADLPINAHKTTKSAEVPGSDYDVRIVGGWAQSRLSATFTHRNDRAVPRVNVRARTLGPYGAERDDDFLERYPLLWHRESADVLSLHARNAQYANNPRRVDLHLIRVENDEGLDPELAEASIIAIGALMQRQIQPAAPSLDRLS
jgi:hypothetical protein